MTTCFAHFAVAVLFLAVDAVTVVRSLMRSSSNFDVGFYPYLSLLKLLVSDITIQALKFYHIC